MHGQTIFILILCNDFLYRLFLWAKTLQKSGQNIDVVKNISSVSLTHLHLGHVDGLGLFGREVMGCENGSVKLLASKPVLKELESRSLLTPFAPVSIEDGDNIELGPGVKIEFHRVPHREEEGFDTHAIVVRGEKKSLLFLPDHDTYTETLQWKKLNSIRAWFKKLDVDIVLIDGTFFTKDEISIRREDACNIPHPSIKESLNLLGQRKADDPEIFFIHLNHTNSIIDNAAKQAEVTKLGWGIGQQGQLFIV